MLVSRAPFIMRSTRGAGAGHDGPSRGALPPSCVRPADPELAKDNDRGPRGRGQEELTESYLHGLDPRVVLRRQLVEDEIAVLVHSDQVLRFEVLRLDQPNYGQENRLPRCRLHHQRLALVGLVGLRGIKVRVRGDRCGWLLLASSRSDQWHNISVSDRRLLDHWRTICPTLASQRPNRTSWTRQHAQAKYNFPTSCAAPSSSSSSSCAGSNISATFATR